MTTHSSEIGLFLPVTYPFTRSACKVDAFLFFQSECRFSHFWSCICSFSITISVLDGPLKQMKDIDRASGRFLCYSYESEEALTHLFTPKIHSWMIWQSHEWQIQLGEWNHPKKPGQPTYDCHIVFPNKKHYWNQEQQEPSGGTYCNAHIGTASTVSWPPKMRKNRSSYVKEVTEKISSYIPVIGNPLKFNSKEQSRSC